MGDGGPTGQSSRAQLGVIVGAACSVLAGCAALLGWWTRETALIAIAPGWPSMVPATAIGLILAGLSLGLLGRGGRPAPLRRLGLASAAAVTALGLASLAQYVFGWDLGVDRLLFPARVDFPSKFPGRSSPNSALGFALIGAALLSMPMRTPRACRRAVGCVLVVVALALTPLTGYLLGVGYFYGLPPLFPFTGMPFHAAIALLALSAGILAAQPDCGAFAVLTSSAPGGVLLRRLLPFVVIVPIVLGRLFLIGADRGAYPIDASFSLASAVTMLFLATVLWMSAARLNDLDEARRQAEEARAFLATLAHSSDDAVIGADLDGTIVSWNPAAERLFGHSAGEVVGRKASILYPSELAREAEANFERLRRGERFERFETATRARDGRNIDVEITVSAVASDAGRVIGFSAICRDIGRRKAMEAALERAHAAERRIRSQLEAIGAASAAVTEALASLPPSELGAVLKVIAHHAKGISGADYAAIGIAEAPGRPFDPWVPCGVDAEQVAQIRSPPRSVGILGAVAGGERPVRVDDVRAHADFLGFPPHHPPIEAFLGVPLRFHGRAVASLYLAKRPGRPPFDEDDERVVALLAERTCGAVETARLYRSEADERRRLQAVVEQMPEAALLVDAGGRLISCNRIALEYAVRREGERDPWGNEVLFDHRSPSGDPMDWPDRPMARALCRGEVVTGAEGLLWSPSERAFVPVLVNAAPVRSDDGEVQGAVAVFQDITALKEMERQRQEWTGVIAHDLRQPIQVIATASQLLRRRLGALAALDGEKQIGRIAGSVDRLRRMIDDLLDASRIEARQLTLDPCPVDLRAHLGEILERSAGATEGHAVCLEVQGDVPAVQADPGRLEQIVTNLLSNAARYGDPGRDIVVTVRAGADAAHIAVTNWGKGIAEAMLPHLFQRFSRAPGSTPGHARGVGLGLYITRGLVEAHGGSISVESTPGAATTFRFTMPFAAPAALPAAT
ncbi:PAS domain S-box protein [Sorangium sp. So ce315]|uniref:PAS domain S-box protein n=1 Tax=Sorangium sp. So ce315 TaxID=3133299 RepID=UPI003F61DC33